MIAVSEPVAIIGTVAIVLGALTLAHFVGRKVKHAVANWQGAASYEETPLSLIAGGAAGLIIVAAAAMIAF